MIQEKLLGKKAINYEKCPSCEKDVPEHNIHNVAFYHPFNKEPSFEGKLCERCIDYSDISFCEDCGRDVYNNNGYRINTRYDEKAECIVCVACLQKEWFEKGMDRFKQADWFNDSDLTLNGFNKHGSYFCRSNQSYKDAEKEFDELQEQGYKAIVSIERSGMGFEYHIAIWKKA